VSTSVLLPALVAAEPTAANCSRSSGFLGFPTWYKYLITGTSADFDATNKECKLNFDIQNPGDLGKVGLAVVEIVLRLAGLVAVAFVVYGGIQYVLSQGDPQKAVSARKTIINAAIGMVIALMATFIVSLMGNSLIK
jgi:hypothetical protein